MESIEEIKQILKEIAVQQAKNELEFAKTDAMLKETSAQIKATDAQIKATDERLDKLFQESREQIKATDAKLKEIGRQLGDIGHSNGDVAEEFFYNSLNEHKYLGAIRFDEVSKNIKTKKHRLEDEYDVFMENGNAVAIVEVKHKVKQGHIEKLIEKKAKNFRILFPDYANYKLYVGIAGMAFEPHTEDFATQNGIAILKQKGDVMQVNTTNMRAF